MQAPESRSFESENRRANRDAAQVGSALGRGFRCQRRWPYSGAKICGGARAEAAGAEARGSRRRRARADAPRIAGGGIRQAGGGFRELENPLGRYQSIPAADRRYRAAVQRRGPEHPGRFTSAQWGSLASFGARAYPGTKKWYGTSGNSFVAVVEFGDKVRAKAVTAGGESGHPSSKHFNDEASAVRYRSVARRLFLSGPTKRSR